MIPRDLFLINKNIDVFISYCKRDLNKHCTVSTRVLHEHDRVMESKKMKFDTIQKMNDEMTEFLDQFPEKSKDMQKTLTQLETDVTAIHSLLMKKTKKVTLVQINQKLDVILKTLLQNGLTYQEE